MRTLVSGRRGVVGGCAMLLAYVLEVFSVAATDGGEPLKVYVFVGHEDLPKMTAMCSRTPTDEEKKLLVRSFAEVFAEVDCKKLVCGLLPILQEGSRASPTEKTALKVISNLSERVQAIIKDSEPLMEDTGIRVVLRGCSTACAEVSLESVISGTLELPSCPCTPEIPTVETEAAAQHCCLRAATAANKFLRRVFGHTREE